MPRRFWTVWFTVYASAFLLGHSFAGAVESLQAVRIEDSEMPVIDGDLSDPVWEQAALIENLTQMYPVEQSAPSETTEIRLCFDARNLYLSFRCLDRVPEEVNAAIMQRDQKVGADDYVFLILDPYQTGREGFYFRLNANGAKGDGRVTGFSKSPNMDWDTIWHGAGRHTDEGWAAEFAIPFRSISFDPAKSTWNANFGRWLPRAQERDRWSGALRHRSFLKLEDAGQIIGLTNLERGRGVDLKPYLSGRQLSGTTEEGFYNEYGADVFWQVTPNLTTTLTWNTDFAETEVDDRVVNLTRFPLFFPEKRDFFLEGQEYFEFGPVSKSLRAFHSRTIGLSNRREKVDIMGGAKVTGRIGKLGVGMFGTALADSRGLEEDEIGVLRLTYDLGEKTRVGSFFSYGDPQQNGENMVGGLDFDYKNSHFGSGNDQIEFKAFQLTSQDAATNLAHSFGAEFFYPNEPLSFRLGVRQIDENFDPGQGYVRRPGTRRGLASVQREFYPNEILWLREVSLETSGLLYTNLDSQLESAEIVPVELGVEFENGDEFVIYPEWNREVLFAPFAITDAVTIATGSYDFGRLVAGIETSNHRPVSVEVFGRVGEFYNGTRHGYSTEVEWRPSPFWGMEAGVDFDMIHLPGGEFEVLVGSTGIRVTPNPKVSWNTIVQWDSVSNNVGLNSRLRYIVSPGNDIFLVFNQGFLYTPERDFHQENAEATAKVGWTFRY